MGKRATVTLALSAALILAGQPAQAQGSRHGGGRHPGGGGHYGGSYAVPRGGGYGGGMAQGRHPRAGTGGYGYGYHHYPYYGGGHYRPYYNGYYGHYGYGYGYGYYRPYSSFYFGFGWPYGYAGWGWPYGGGGYYPSYSYAPYGYEAPPAREPERSYDDRYSSERPAESDHDTGRVRLDVAPGDASVYVDDAFWGNAREARQMTLRSGHHSIEVVRPGFETARHEVEVARGETSELRIDLRHQ